jgi:hypothetical protein
MRALGITLKVPVGAGFERLDASRRFETKVGPRRQVVSVSVKR